MLGILSRQSAKTFWTINTAPNRILLKWQWRICRYNSLFNHLLNDDVRHFGSGISLIGFVYRSYCGAIGNGVVILQRRCRHRFRCLCISAADQYTIIPNTGTALRMFANGMESSRTTLRFATRLNFTLVPFP